MQNNKPKKFKSFFDNKLQDSETKKLVIKLKTELELLKERVKLLEDTLRKGR